MSTTNFGPLPKHYPCSLYVNHCFIMDIFQNRFLITDRHTGCDKSYKQCTIVCQQICCVCKFLEPVQRFLHQYHMLLLSFTLTLLSLLVVMFFVYVTRLTWMSRRCVYTALIKFILSTFFVLSSKISSK